MPFLSKMMSLWRNLFRRKQVEQDLDDELQAYVEEMTARGAGLTELGDIDRIKDLVRQQRVGFGGLPKVATILVVAVIAFVSGASAAIGAMKTIRWNTPSVAPKIVATPVKAPVPKVPWPRMEGRVVDKTTGEPIPYIEVGLMPNPTTRRYTYADKAGRFFFDDPPSQGYRLDAGEEQWGISGFDVFTRRGVNPPPNDNFHLFDPKVVVTDKTGHAIEGESEQLKGVFYSKRTKETRPEVITYRRFHYADSIVELRTNKPAGMKEANFIRYSSTKSQWQSSGSDPKN